jgi:hypothetical protein
MAGTFLVAVWAAKHSGVSKTTATINASVLWAKVIEFSFLTPNAYFISQGAIDDW